MKLNEIFGACMYNWYGAGSHQSIGRLPLSVNGLDLVNADGKWVSTIRALPNFKLHRAFVDNWSIVPETQPPFTIKVQPTEQNFYYDDFFKLQKANGIKNILSLSGCFDWYKAALGSHSQRKSACYNPAMSPTDPAAWQDLAHLCKLVAERYRDNGLVDYIQVLNEWDFRWNVPHIVTPEEYAVGFYECYKAIRSVSTTQKIMVGCTLTPEMPTIIRLFAKLDSLAASEGKPKVRDVTVTFNLYSRSKSANQGEGVGATFEETDQYGRFLKPLNDWCEQEGVTWAMTESGYNSSPSTSAAAMKNRAPQLEGFTIEESQGILAIRTALICASLSKCVGVTFYHCKDGYEAEPFTYHGFNYDKDFGGKPDWSAKPARTICEEFLEKYGEHEVGEFRRNPIGTYYVGLDLNGTYTLLAWTDKNVLGTVTPMPAFFWELPPTSPMPTLTVVNKQLQWSDGVPCNLIHADSPESRLHPNYKAQFSAECKLLPTYGINTITVTMRGDDVTAISPFINNNPSQGIDVAKIQTWHGQLKEFLTECENSGLRGVIIAYLGERTNFKSITDQQYENWFIEMGKIFQDISGQIIFGWEEIWDGSDSATMRFADRIGSLLKSYLPNSLLMVHNNPGQKPFNAGSSFVKLICIQETSVSAMKATAEAALSKGFAVHFHELYPGFKLSNSQDTNKKLMAELVTAAKSVGVNNVGCFASDYDLQAPDASKLSYLYQYQSQLINGATPPPNPTPMTIKYSTSVTHPADAPELKDNLNLAPGNYAVFTDVAGTFDLYKNGVRFSNYFPHPENGAPFDMYGTSGSNANLFPFTQGSWKLEFTDKSNNKTTVNFTVGETVPPPTGDSPVTTITHKADGKLVFKSEDGRERVI